MKLFWRLGLLLCSMAIWVSCGDTFRPVIIPNPPKFPDPRAAHTVLSVNNNGASRGSAMVTDVSGDTDVSVADMGIAPIHAVQQASNQVLIVNSPDPSALADSISKVVFSGVTIGSTTTISLPQKSGPTFVAVAPNDTAAYVTLPNLVPDPINFPNDNAVQVVNTASNALGATIRVGNNPVALAVTPDRSKLYVANQGDGTLDAFNTVDQSARTVVGSLSSPPIWLSVRSDSQRVFVLEQNGTIAWVDTVSTIGQDAITETPISVPGAVSMLYDGNLNRLYIPGGTQLTVVDVAPSAPQLLKTISIPKVPSLPPVDAIAVAVAALPDGSRAYVASVPAAPQPSQVTISSVKGDGARATYTYTLTGGHDLTSGIPIAVSGITTPDGFDGTFTITAVSGTACDQPAQVCTFQAANTTVADQTTVAGLGSSTIDHLFPQVTVINTSGNTIKSTTSVPGFPDATIPSSPYFVPVCATTRFRLSMAAGGDSSRVYLASCDGGMVNIIRTSDDTYVLNLPEPASERAPIPPSTQPPPQNPVFLLAGP